MPNSNGQWVKTGEATQILNRGGITVSRATVGRWAKEGKLGHVKTIGGHARFRVSDLEALVDQLTHRVEEAG